MTRPDGAGSERQVMLLAGCASLPALLSSWARWRADAQRCRTLWLIWIVANDCGAHALRESSAARTRPELATLLSHAWPPSTPDLHTLEFERGQVRVLLAPGNLERWLKELRMPIDAFVLDPPPAASMRHRLKALARLAAPGATLAGWPDAPPALLRAAGFEPGATGEAPAVHSPTFVPRGRTAFGAARLDRSTPVVVIGAGLAGCASAWALSELGLRCLLLERQPCLANEASGNPAGLFHGIVNRHDGVHARFNRAAALQASAAVRVAVDAHGVRGAASGLLRLETRLDLPAMTALLAGLGLAPAYVRAVDAAEAQRLAGLVLHGPAWFYPSGGWVDPAGLARSFVERAGDAVALRCGAEVARLERAGKRWRVFDAADAVLAETGTVVLANAGDALRLLGEPAWPIVTVRGQLSWLDRSAAPGLTLPRLPIAGAGYLLPEVGGQAIFGATATPGDLDARVRETDHHANLAQLARLIGRDPAIDSRALGGRTAWRWVAPDRLPLIGAVPDAVSNIEARPAIDQVRHVPRLPGLFVFTALGSRGITSAALGARLLAAQVSGSPPPLPASLCDAVDPARFAVRTLRRAR